MLLVDQGLTLGRAGLGLLGASASDDAFLGERARPSRRCGGGARFRPRLGEFGPDAKGVLAEQHRQTLAGLHGLPLQDVDTDHRPGEGAEATTRPFKGGVAVAGRVARGAMPAVATTAVRNPIPRS